MSDCWPFCLSVHLRTYLIYPQIYTAVCLVVSLFAAYVPTGLPVVYLSIRQLVYDLAICRSVYFGLSSFLHLSVCLQGIGSGFWIPFAIPWDRSLSGVPRGAIAPDLRCGCP